MSNQLTKEKKPFEDVMMALLTDIASAGQREAETTYREAITHLLQTHKEFLLRPDTFDVLINFEISESVEVLIRNLYPKLPEIIINKVIFLYQRYGFCEQQLEKLIESRETYVCVNDKTKWLLESYLVYLQEQKFPDMTIGEKCFWKPHFGTAEIWMTFIESFEALYYGDPSSYIENYGHLLKAERVQR